MPSYGELKVELLEISKIIEKFPEQVKSQVYELLVQEFLGKRTPLVQTTTPPSRTQATADSHKKRTITKDKETKGGKKGAGKESYSIDRDLNLRGDKSIPSFKLFYADKKPRSAKEFNAVTVYYLKKMLGLEGVTLDHAFTCYAEVQRKPPKAFRQSFIDTKNKEGWVEFDSAGNLDIPHRGTVFVEHDLPPPEETRQK